MFQAWQSGRDNPAGAYILCICQRLCILGHHGAIEIVIIIIIIIIITDWLRETQQEG